MTPGDKCIKSSTDVDFNGAQCPTNCEAFCTGKAIFCPGQIDPYTGCPMPDSCVTGTTFDRDGAACEVHCAVKCGPNDISCPGIIDDNGCKMKDVCVPPSTKFGYDGWLALVQKALQSGLINGDTRHYY